MSDSLNGVSEADKETWAQLWANLHYTHYSAFYDEMCAEWSVTFWKRFDATSKFLQLMTASSSAIAGWALWQTEGFKWLWALFAGSAAVIALIHTVLNVSEKIREDTLVYSEFRKVRLELERLKAKMEIKTSESLADYKREYLEILERFGSADTLKKPDLAFTKTRSERIQAELNRRLGYEQ